MQDTNLKINKKNSFTQPSFMLLHFRATFPTSSFIFSEYTQLGLPKRLSKCASTISFRKYKRKVVIYLFNYDSFKSTFFMFWIWCLTFSWVQFLSHKLEFFVPCNIKITRTSCFFFDMYFFIKTYLFSIMMIIIFYSILISASNSHFQLSMKKW